ncbi:MAG: tol-pal system protein YbgF [Halioglobus sp.]|nr:tol-pal system protein YbgF [Halioglobus sp.]
MDDIKMASLVLAIAFSAPVFAQSSDREQMVDMVLQIQALQDEVRTLRGMIEEQQHLIDTLQRRQRDQYLDLDQRIGELAAPRTLVPNGQAAQSASGSNVIPPAEDVPEVRAPVSQPSTVTTIATPEAAARPASQSPQAEKAMYDQAFQALKDLRYADAAEGFQDFLNQYPDSEYADNAQYWLGESYYVTRNYEIALEAFQALLDNYPQSLKVPDSLLKVGYTHYELKQWDLARAALTQVQEQYPDTTVARLAENRLRSMRVEGHF